MTGGAKEFDLICERQSLGFRRKVASQVKKKPKQRFSQDLRSCNRLLCRLRAAEYLIQHHLQYHYYTPVREGRGRGAKTDPCGNSSTNRSSFRKSARENNSLFCQRDNLQTKHERFP